MPEALIILPCATCGSPGKVIHSGIFWYVVPKRVKDCELHKHPYTRPCGGIVSACRSGFTTTREDAIAQWTSMQQPKERKAHD